MYLGIDGGGSTTTFVLTNSKGEVLARHNDQPTNYLVNGLDHTAQVFERGVKSICQLADISVDDIVCCFCAVAGYGDIVSDIQLVNEKLEAVFPNLNLKLGNDTENAHAGSLAGQVGINIIAGTGSISYGVDDENQSIRVGGWHHLFGGDEGSAYWIASKLLLMFTRQSDNRDERTYLYYYLKEKYGWKDDSGMLDLILNEWKEDRTKIASMAQDVSYCASQGDLVCIDILDEAALELAEIIIATYNQLEFSDETLCSYSGGVFKSGDLVLKPLRKYLSDLPITLIEPILSPLAGAVVLAMKIDNIKIPIDRLKAIN